MITIDTPEQHHLGAVQRWFEAVVTHPGGVEAGAASPGAQQYARLGRDELERMVQRSPSLTAHDRLSIYANAYYARLLECMAESFPIFQKAVGEDLFSDFAFAYLQQCPPTSYSLNHLADRFPDFLRHSAPGTEGAEADWVTFLVDLAHLEWTIAQVFDGPGTESMDLPGPEDLRALDPDAWRQARIELAPCLRLLACRCPVNGYYTRARADDQAPDPPAAAAAWVAVSRRDFVVRRFDLEAGEYVLLEALGSGQCVEEAIQISAATVELDDAALAMTLQCWFTRWSKEGFFASIC